MKRGKIEFNQRELARYSRHLTIPDFGREGQEKLKGAKILVIGTGGLGAPLLQYLVAAGAGTIGIVDFDRVEESNLQRQILFGVEDVGKLKTEVAGEKLQKLNPFVKIIIHNTRLTSENAMDIFEDYDIVADGTDNFPTRYLVNDACVFSGKPNIYASIFQFEGQVSVFNYRDTQGNLRPNYRDLYPTPPPPGLVPSCAEGGVLGVLPGIIGSLQANEVIKVITGIGEPLAGKLFLFDALKFRTQVLKVEKDENNPLTGKHPTQKELIDYEEFCGVKPQPEQLNGVKEISVHELQQLLENNEPFQLIDVREPHEYQIANIGGELIPLGQVLQSSDKIPRDKKVVIHCHSGGRSERAVQLLQEQFGFNNLYNLKGGILAYAREIDSSLQTY